jgi:hypothetical protein
LGEFIYIIEGLMTTEYSIDGGILGEIIGTSDNNDPLSEDEIRGELLFG